jgi:hypothetical protein
VRRRVHGNFKSLLSRLPEEVANELREQLQKTGQQVLHRAESRAPIYRGRPRKGRVAGTLRSSLSAKVLQKGLKLKVGIVGKADAKKAYYARFVEFGHRIGFRGNRLAKQQPITAKGRTRRLILARRRQQIRTAGVAARPFLYTFNREELYQPFQKLWTRAIRKAAAGASDE